MKKLLFGLMILFAVSLSLTASSDPPMMDQVVSLTSDVPAFDVAVMPTFEDVYITEFTIVQNPMEVIEPISIKTDQLTFVEDVGWLISRYEAKQTLKADSIGHKAENIGLLTINKFIVKLYPVSHTLNTVLIHTSGGLPYLKSFTTNETTNINYIRTDTLKC